MSATVRFARSRCWLLFGFNLNNAVGINFWDCFHYPRSPSRSRVMVILVIRLQFHVLSPLLFQRVIIHMAPCTVARRHACNLVMIEAILCAAATCYDINGCIRSCWCMGDSKCKDSTLHIQAEQTQFQWKQPFLVCCFHDAYNIMARRICINRFWFAGGKAIILIGFPFYTCIVGVNPQPWMPINTQTKECITSIRSTWVALIPPNTMLKSWTEILQKSVQSWYIPFALQACYDIRASKIVHV